MIYVGLIMNKSIVLFALLILCWSCVEKKSVTDVLQKSIEAHGMDHLSQKGISFNFRSKNYSVARTGDDFVYIRSYNEDSLSIKDVLKNSVYFERFVNGEPVTLSQDWKDRYGSSVNSVLYFFQIPFVLQDKAAIKSLEGKEDFRNQTYFKIKVVFAEENGGEDHEDEFLYWINSENYLVDFLAYSYQTDGGGVRFRAAINRTEVDGIVFQDYVNYGAKTGTPLHALLQLFGKNQLKELSVITNEDIKISKLD